MAKPTIVNHSEIINYYESCEEQYALLWHLDTHGAMHYGYWTAETRNLKEALFNLNDLLANEAQLDNSKLVLDAGCGVGGSSFYIAQKYGCKSHGITLSNKHVAFANQKAKQQNLDDKVTFSVADYTKTDFTEETFDVVLAIESVCHANEKREFLAEAYRVLKKGGKVVMTDFFRTSEVPNAKESYWLDNWARTWAIPHFEFRDSFIEKAKEVGFSVTKRSDITKGIYKSALYLYLYFYPGLLWNWLLQLVGKHNLTHITNLWSTFYQFHSLKKGY